MGAWLSNHALPLNMKSKTRSIVLVLAGIVLFVIGCCVGGVYAAQRVSYGCHSATLVWLTGFHSALDEQNYDQARELASKSVDAHIGVLQKLEADYFVAAMYASPWSRHLDSFIRDALVNSAKYFEKHQEQLKPETLAFLKKHVSAL